MKKMKFILVLLVGLLLVVTCYKSASASDNLQEKYCPKEPYDIAGGGTRVVQKAVGANFLASKIAEATIKKNIHSFAKGKVNVKVKSFSASDAKKGKFKSFEIKCKNLSADALYMSELYVKSMCGFISIDINSNPIKFREPLLLDFTAKFSENDLNKMIFSSKFNKYLDQLNKQNYISIKEPKISLKGDKFQFLTKIELPFVGTFYFNFKSDLAITDNKIKIVNMHIGTISNLLNISKIKYIVNLVDPLWFAQIIVEQQNHCKVILKSVKIQNENIVILGSVLLKKS